MHERAGGGHKDDTLIGKPAQEVVHDDGSDECFAEPRRQAHEGVVHNRSENDVSLIFPELWARRND